MALVVVVIGVLLTLELFFVDKEATLLIDFDNMKRMFKGEVVENMTLLDALNISAEAGKIKLRYVVDSGNHTAVAEINDHVAGNKNFSFYINNKTVKTDDLNKTIVNPGDEITIKLE